MQQQTVRQPQQLAPPSGQRQPLQLFQQPQQQQPAVQQRPVQTFAAQQQQPQSFSSVAPQQTFATPRPVVPFVVRKIRSKNCLFLNFNLNFKNMLRTRNNCNHCNSQPRSSSNNNVRLRWSSLLCNNSNYPLPNNSLSRLK